MWVKLKVSKVINHEKFGIGDWVPIGRDLALKWIASEHAEALNFEGTLSEEGIGIVYPPSRKQPALPIKQIRAVEALIQPQFERTLFMDAAYSIADRDSPNILRNVGRMAFLFELLKKWDVVLILASYKINASKVGAAEHKHTVGIIHDLRVPYYQQCIWGARDNDAGRAFCNTYLEEREHGKTLALLRALYRSQPMAYYLPPDFGKVE